MTTTITLHSVRMTGVRRIARNLHIGVNAPATPPRGIRVYGESLLSLFRKVPERGPGGFRGTLSNWITRKGCECFKVEVWNDDFTKRFRRNYGTRKGAEKAFERVALAIVGGA